jgi:hypothetical protein
VPRFNHACDYLPPEIDPEELCISSQLSPETTHIARLWRGLSEPWQVASSSIITDLSSGKLLRQTLFLAIG